MRNYKIPVLSISKFSDKDFNFLSLSARDYRKLDTKNKNIIKLGDLLETKHKVGKEIGSESYMPKSQHRFLKTVNISKNFLLAESVFEYCKPTNKIFPKKNEILIAKDGGGDGLGEACLYPYENKENLDSLSAGVISINIVAKKLYYVFGMLKSQHFKDHIDLNTAQGSTIRYSKLAALDYEIPFPTKNNHTEPQKIEQLVSLITQNIINKEEQIKSKNQKIDELIEKELKQGQKPTNGFVYEYPTISEIKRETRLDTGIYERKFKEIDFLIKNYKESCNPLNNYTKSFKSGSTPYFFEKKSGDYPYFVRPTEYGDKRTYDSLRKVHFDKNITKYRIDREIGIILPRIGGINAILKPKDFNVLIGDNVKFGTFKNIDTTFLASFLTSKIVRIQLEKIKSKTNGGSLTEKNLKNLLIPNFPDQKQQEIAKEYYNKIDKNQNLTLENYLKKETARNQQIGIFQLNMEIFILREKLEEIIDKIINDLPIEINLNY